MRKMLFLFSALFFLVEYSAAQSPTDIAQAKRMHERLTGVAPSVTVLNDMATEISNGDGEAAAQIAMDNDNFYRVTLKNWVAPWTNRDHDVFVPLNDYIATVMGYIRDERDFRGILEDDLIYTFSNLPAPNNSVYSPLNNDHYEDAEATDPQSYRFIDNLFPPKGSDQLQTSLNTNLPSGAAAGVMTTRAAAEAFFVDGTNRAMLRYTLVNHMCVDLEQLQDATLSPDRIRQDVSRSPGGDSRVFNSNCATCHSGMDPLAQAFAYYDFVNEEDRSPTNFLEYTPDQGIYEPYGDFEVPINQAVNAKYHINENTFIFGYRTPDDSWDNYWREGANQFLDWSGGLPGSGQGAASLGEELANSGAFAQCQVQKVFESICLREPNTSDSASFEGMVASFQTGNYNLKQTFAEVADYCKGG